MQNDNRIFGNGTQTTIQPVQQNVVMTITSETIRLFIANLGIDFTYPVAHLFAAVVIVFPENVIT